MGPDIVVPVSLFLMVLGIVGFSVNASMQKRKATLKVVEEAIRSGQTMTPETIRALGMPRKDRNGDLKGGLILIAVAAAFLVLGWTVGMVEGEDEAMYIMPAIASFPGFIGLVLVGFGLLGSKKDGSE
ncbi:hypothetical protein AWH62_03620 [Maricaulis sp. W15]|uniref:DUF6249 domain-containing protein n=1 Tax=Maricaulis sp. W15 TaxID=1772333 RepID=UPI000948EC1C|nr:DUF6249 domain-containing protein [Maricaulis sp. W15]OLF78057.1 hypothetical protein AWH62_03620 [Maricaulis sp. W15]